MYITVKQGTKYEQHINKSIDDMFKTLEVPDDLDIVESSTVEDSRIVRTKTYNVTEAQLFISNNTWIDIDKKLKYYCKELTDIDKQYYTFKIPKRTHGFRTINAPNEYLKYIQKSVAIMLEKDLHLLVHDCAWAYVSGRDIVGAMNEHRNNNSRWFLKIDLHDFFGSCTPEIIKSRLKNLYPFSMVESNTIIDNIIHLAVLNGGLPQGTPLSPILTNLIMVETDYNIQRMIYKLTKENKLFKQKYIYTRYADDIIISARNKFDYTNLMEALKEVLAPFQINEEKTRFGSSSGRNWNLGVMYNKDNNITVGHKRKHDVKILVYNYTIQGDTWTLEDYRYLLGQLSWIKNVEPEYCKGLLNYFQNKYKIDIWQSLIKDIKRSINN